MLAVLLLAASLCVAAASPYVNVTSCGYGRYVCSGIYRPYGTLQITGAPVWVKEGGAGEPGFVRMPTGWMLVFPGEGGLVATRTPTAVAYAPATTGWGRVNDFCCAPNLELN